MLLHESIGSPEPAGKASEAEGEVWQDLGPTEADGVGRGDDVAEGIADEHSEGTGILSFCLPEVHRIRDRGIWSHEVMRETALGELGVENVLPRTI